MPRKAILRPRQRGALLDLPTDEVSLHRHYTLADAILGRLVHNAYQLNLKGESMRKRCRPLTDTLHRGA